MNYTSVGQLQLTGELNKSLRTRLRAVLVCVCVYRGEGGLN